MWLNLRSTPEIWLNRRSIPDIWLNLRSAGEMKHGHCQNIANAGEELQNLGIRLAFMAFE
jgi:hypothetical protein